MTFEYIFDDEEKSKKYLLKLIYLKEISGNLGKSSLYRDTLTKKSTTIKKLIEEGLIDNNLKLTLKGRRNIKVGIIGGVFDIIHAGHISLLKTAKQYVDVLIAIIATDRTVEKSKDRKPINTAEKRKMVVEAIRYVDMALIGDEEDFRKPLELIKPDIIFLGYDQKIPPGISGNDLRNIQVIKLNKVVNNLKTSHIIQKLRREKAGK